MKNLCLLLGLLAAPSHVLATEACLPVNTNPGESIVGKALSDEEFSRTWVAMQAALAGQPRLDNRAKDAVAVRAALLGVPNVVDTGISADCSIWLRLSDGSPLVILNPWLNPSLNPLPAPDRDTELDHTQLRMPNTFHEFASLALEAPTALPASTKAVIGFADNLAPNSSKTIKEALELRGYNVEAGVTTAALRNNMKDVGVFWLSTHGAVYTDHAGRSRYGVVTDEVMDPKTGMCQQSKEACDENRDDVRNDRAFVGTLRGQNKGFYLINSDWVEKYWRFSANSLVVLDACNSMDKGLEYEEFRKTLETKANMGTLVGWVGEVYSQSAETIMSYFTQLFPAFCSLNRHEHVRISA